MDYRSQDDRSPKDNRSLKDNQSPKDDRSQTIGRQVTKCTNFAYVNIKNWE